MRSTLTWIDLTASDRDKMRRVLDLLKEQGTIDEMGLGSLRDILSDALFPGTSTIQTRLRYVLFIPWIYQRLEARKIDAGNVATQLRQVELDLIKPLTDCEDSEGTIGVRARGSLSRLPSSVYWTALVRWKIFQHEQSQGWYHTNFAELVRRRSRGMRTDDPGIVQMHQPNWHPRLPKKPPSFPQEASFSLTSEEAKFLQGRLEDRCSGTLLAWLARQGLDESSDGSFWNDSTALQANTEILNTIELARRFSLHVEGMPLLYNLLLAECFKKEHDGDDKLIEKYRAALAEWATREVNEGNFDPNKLWDYVVSRNGRLPAPQRRFVEAWSQQIAAIRPSTVLDDPTLRRLIAQREYQLKGLRARLANPKRLLDWKDGVGVGRMNFRWPRARKHLIDLHQGLTT